MIKNTFLFVLSIIWVLTGKADTLNSITVYDTIAIDLIEKYQIDKTTQQKNGYYLMQYKGKVLTKGAYKNGQRDGGWLFVGMNDTVQQKGVYVDGKKDGMWTSYYSDGKVSCYMTFKNGLRDGIFKGKHKNGNVSFEIKYINNHAEGVSTNYYSNGKVFYTLTYVNDTLNGLAKKYYENGILQEEKYFKSGERDSVYLFYYDNGTLWEHIIYRNGNEYNVIAYNGLDGKSLNCCTLKDGNGIMRFYDNEGRITSEVTYKNSIKDGPAKYAKNGIVTTEGNFTAGKYDGVWLEYYDTGELYSKTSYVESEKDGSSFYYLKDGNVSMEGQYKDDEKEGLWKKYDADGSIRSETNYSKGMYNGLAKNYSSGIITNSGEYINGNKIGIWKYYDKKGRFASKLDYGTLTVKSNEKESYFFNSVPEKKDTENTYTIVEQMPEFPGGLNMMIEFIRNNVVYPKTAKNDGVSGTVYVNFVVSNTGEVNNVTILRGAHYELDKEAMRIVTYMPRWSAGMQNGQPVSVSYNLPIKFTLK